MGKIKLDSILLFALSIPFIMNYRISPGDTPLWLFSFIFLFLTGYIVLDLTKLKENLYYRLKHLLLWLVIFATLGSGFYSAIVVRHKVSPVYNIHDIVLQQEAALRFFLDGKNPYATTYFGTLLEQFHYSETETNPALYHFVMEPFYLLFTIPFYYVSVHTFGFFDGRIPLFLLFLSTLVLSVFLIKDKEKRLLFMTIFAFNPAMLSYTLEGRSDMFMFGFMFPALFFLYKNKYSWGGFFMALAFAVKQSAWPILPFYFLYLYFRKKTLKETFKSLVVFVATLTVIISPFYLWDRQAFLDSTISYLSGSVPHSYPISGYGFGALMHQLGFIKDINPYYPFIIWQAIFSIPVLFLMYKYFRKVPTVKNLITFYGIYLFIFWYFSRYFNNSHVGFLSVVFITAYFWPEEE